MFDLYLVWIYFSVSFSHYSWYFLEDMAGINQSVVKIVNIHQSKINMVKFDSMNNFGMWRCEVMDVLNVQNLEDTLLLQEKPAETLKND